MEEVHASQVKRYDEEIGRSCTFNNPERNVWRVIAVDAKALNCADGESREGCVLYYLASGRYPPELSQ